jgi:hypothetical protein
MHLLSRRALLALSAVLPALPFFARPAVAFAGIGEAVELTGDGTLIRDGAETPLKPGTLLQEGDDVLTGENALALLMLENDTLIKMGPGSRIMLTSYLAEAGGVITVGGAIVFDRPDDLPPIDLTFVTEFGEIGVRGTRFFIGPSRGAQAVFVQRGRVTVTNAGVVRELGVGDGVDMAAGAAPSEVVQWKEARIVEAFALVGLTP